MTYTYPYLGSSISVTALDTWDSDTSSCTSSRPVSTSTSIYNYGRGNGNGYIGSGKWNLCSGSLSSASLDVDFYYKTSDWISADTDYQYCDVPYTNDVDIDSVIYGDTDVNCTVEVIGDISNPDQIKAKWYVNGDRVFTDDCEGYGCDDHSDPSWEHKFTLDESEYSKGDEVYCIGRGDGEDGGHGAYEESSKIIVSNRAPTMSGVNLNKDVAVFEEAISVSIAGEADGDQDSLSLYCCNGESCTPSISNHDFCYSVGNDYPYILQCNGQSTGTSGTQTVRCRSYDGEDYSSIYSDTYLMNDTMIINIISPEDWFIFNETVPTARFNVSTSQSADECKYSFDYGEINYTMSRYNSTYFYDVNETMVDGWHDLTFYCDKSLDGNWVFRESEGFEVDSLNVTRCRSLYTRNRDYILTNSISNSGTYSQCISFADFNISLDCKGGEIDGTDEGGFGVQDSGGAEATLKNCIISDWVIGAMIDQGLDIENTSIVSNGWGVEMEYNDEFHSIINNSAVMHNEKGIVLKYSTNFTLSNSNVSNNSEGGITLLSRYSDELSVNNSFYNNYFNNTININFSTDKYYNSWNITKTLKLNIIGGDYIGGNFWAQPDGNGYSETCYNSDGDGICDNPYTIGTYNIDYLPLTPYDILGPPDDTHKFYIKNSTNDAVAWIGSEGNIVLGGSCFSGGSCDSAGTGGSFIVKNNLGQNVAFINSTGDLCVEVGDCSDESATCNPTTNAFIVRNSALVNVSYIDYTGNLCLTGELYENAQL